MRSHFYLLLVGLISLGSFAQVAQFQDNQYEFIDGKWHLISPEDGTRFQIVDNTLTVKFDSAASVTQIREFETQNNLTFLRKALTGWHDYEVAAGVDIFALANNVGETSLVSNVEIPTMGFYTLVPDDSLYNNLWHLNQGNDIDISAEEAWDITTGDPSVIVSVLDSGVDWIHPDLGLGADSYENIYLNPGEDAWTDPNDPSTGNGIDDDGNGLIDDWKGWNFGNNWNDARQDQGGNQFFHGSHVSGIVAAKTNNGLGVAGVAGGWNNEGAKILACAVGITGPNGSVLDDAILYAAEIGSRQVQLSLTVGPSSAINDAVDMAYDNYGVIIVNASGNGSSSGGAGYPGSLDKVWAVGATTSGDVRASFSNWGTNLFIAAPGVGIWSTGLTSQSPYGSSSGTSFASPIVSGVIALMLSLDPNFTQAEIQQILIDTADKVGGYDYNWNPADPGHSRELGYGRINAQAAVEAAQILSVSDRSTPGLAALYPNPTNDIIYARLQNMDTADLEVSVVGINGQEVMRMTPTAIGSDRFSLNVENLASGLYILRVSNQSNTINAKFIKR